MNLPDYWMPRPESNLDAATRTAFAALIPSEPELDDCPSIQFDLPVPRWQFLCYAAEELGLALHGSGNPDIAIFEPRQSNDLNEFGNQKAIYAAADGIWAMFFAIVDRERYSMSITNASIRIRDPSGMIYGPLYVFSVSQSTLPHQPWREGTVYLLPRDTFITQEPFPFGDSLVYVPQLVSFTAVKPLAKLTIAPQDFPFLAQIRGHDDQRLAEYAQALQTGAPWPGDDLV